MTTQTQTVLRTAALAPVAASAAACTTGSPARGARVTTTGAPCGR